MIHEIDENQLTNEVLKNEKLVLVEFYMKDSKPCEMQHAVLRNIEHDYQETIDVFRIEISDSQEIKIRFELSAMPALLFFKNGHEVERKVGFTEREDVIAIVQELAS